jgi:hypothetical protein
MVSKEIPVKGNDGFELSYDRLLDRTLGPGPIARLLARLHPGSLDAALIAGSDPATSRRLAARAATLTGLRYRAAIADGLGRLLEAADGAPRRASALRQGAHVVANASALRELVAVLRGPAPLYARGIAMVNRLLTDGTGPAYVGDRAALARRLLEARAAIDGRGLDARAQQQLLVKRLGPSHKLAGGSWIYRRHESS